MTRAQRAGRGLRASSIVGQFGEVVIACRREFSPQDNVLAESIKTGVSTTDSKIVSSILPAAELIS